MRIKQFNLVLISILLVFASPIANASPRLFTSGHILQGMRSVNLEDINPEYNHYNFIDFGFMFNTGLSFGKASIALSAGSGRTFVKPIKKSNSGDEDQVKMFQGSYDTTSIGLGLHLIQLSVGYIGATFSYKPYTRLYLSFPDDYNYQSKRLISKGYSSMIYYSVLFVSIGLTYFDADEDSDIPNGFGYSFSLNPFTF